ncbi:MAG: hypothetical protein P4L81_07110, partial [Candidatus Pacebacteria bacterium]|nr:hypothetical protein [Candidatus Paceibacterota bacterium]
PAPIDRHGEPNGRDGQCFAYRGVGARDIESNDLFDRGDGQRRDGVELSPKHTNNIVIGKLYRSLHFDNRCRGDRCGIDGSNRKFRIPFAESNFSG